MSKTPIDSALSALAEALKDPQSGAGQRTESLVFSVEDANPKGLHWTGNGYTKQLIFASNPDRFFLSENVDLARGKSYHINGIKLLDEKELGASISKSSLREVGVLRGLIVEGSLSVNQCLYYDGVNDRLGLGTDQPKASINLVELTGVDIIIGSQDTNRAKIGTANVTDVEIVTDNTARITVSSNGNISLGNKNEMPISVNVHGTMSINVNTPDPRAQLQVAGAVKFNNKLHLSGNAAPTSGTYNMGDIVWNSEPQQRKFIGWVCVREGSPGIWCEFGEIR